jgi:REP-associated tyrosine transposase
MCVESQRTPFVTWRAFYARVMPRTPRERLPDGIYHVTQRGAGKIAIVRDDVDRLFFVRQLKEVVRRFGWLCYVFCLMDNHFHLVIETERSWLSGGMHRLGFLHAQRFNRRYERVGHLFQNRFGAVVIEDDDDLAAVCIYLLSNPVRAGRCERIEDWPWSGGLFAEAETYG